MNTNTTSAAPVATSLPVAPPRACRPMRKTSGSACTGVYPARRRVGIGSGTTRRNLLSNPFSTTRIDPMPRRPVARPRRMDRRQVINRPERFRRRMTCKRPRVGTTRESPNTSSPESSGKPAWRHSRNSSRSGVSDPWSPPASRSSSRDLTERPSEQRARHPGGFRLHGSQLGVRPRSLSGAVLARVDGLGRVRSAQRLSRALRVRPGPGCRIAGAEQRWPREAAHAWSQLPWASASASSSPRAVPLRLYSGLIGVSARSLESPTRSSMSGGRFPSAAR